LRAAFSRKILAKIMFLESRHAALAGALRNSANGEIVAETVEFALSRSARRRGLLGRDSLAAGHGMLIAPCSSVHTWFMRFPIDVIFVTRDGRVVKICRGVGPWRMVMGRGAYATVELPVGAIDRSATAVGHRLELVPPS
jgi:uncharacterized membrane protein (UPF0127 family)